MNILFIFYGSNRNTGNYSLLKKSTQMNSRDTLNFHLHPLVCDSKISN